MSFLVLFWGLKLGAALDSGVDGAVETVVCFRAARTLASPCGISRVVTTATMRQGPCEGAREEEGTGWSTSP